MILIRATKFFRILLASLAIELLLFRLKPKKIVSIHITVFEETLEEVKREVKEQKIRRVVFKPVFYISKKKKYRSKLHYLSTKSRNVRDLDQRKIRRKHINS